MNQQAAIEPKSVMCPTWATAKTCHNLFGLSRSTLNRLVDDGIIRRKKSGDGPSNGALFSVVDINEWFEE
jgi:hypothetical protein